MCCVIFRGSKALCLSCEAVWGRCADDDIFLRIAWSITLLTHDDHIFLTVLSMRRSSFGSLFSVSWVIGQKKDLECLINMSFLYKSIFGGDNRNLHEDPAYFPAFTNGISNLAGFSSLMINKLGWQDNGLFQLKRSSDDVIGKLHELWSSIQSSSSVVSIVKNNLIVIIGVVSFFFETSISYNIIQVTIVIRIVFKLTCLCSSFYFVQVL